MHPKCEQILYNIQTKSNGIICADVSNLEALFDDFLLYLLYKPDSRTGNARCTSTSKTSTDVS